MASIIEVKNGYRAQVRRSGHPNTTKTFSVKTYGSPAAAKKEAEQWARKTEVEVDSGKKIGVHGETGMLFGAAITRYLKENKDISVSAVNVLKALRRDLGQLVIDKMNSNDIITYIKKRNFAPVSGAVYFSYVSTVLKMAKIGWSVYVPDFLEETSERLTFLGLVGRSKERNRRITKEELEMILAYDFPTTVPMRDIILFAISSTMRESEITRICYSTVRPSSDADGLKLANVLVTDRKHPKIKKGNHQVVPLLQESMDIISRQKKTEGDDRIFPYEPKTLWRHFANACKVLKIEDLVFHDLRHEGASRLFEMGYEIQVVAMFTGHLNWKTLQRYTHLKPQDIRSLEPVKKLKTKKIETTGVGIDVEELTKQIEAKVRREIMAKLLGQAEAA